MLPVGDDLRTTIFLGVIGLHGIYQHFDAVPVGAAVHPVQQIFRVHIRLAIAIAHAIQVVFSKGEKGHIIREPRRGSIRDGGDLGVKGRDLLCQLAVQPLPLLRFQGGAVLLYPVVGQIKLGLRIRTVGEILDIELGEHPVVHRPSRKIAARMPDR